MVSRAYPLQWYILDKGAPGNLRVPLTVGRTQCLSKSQHGMVCTRRHLHGGRHAATSSPGIGGGCRVFEVWS